MRKSVRISGAGNSEGAVAEYGAGGAGYEFDGYYKYDDDDLFYDYDDDVVRSESCELQNTFLDVTLPQQEPLSQAWIA